MPFWFCARGHSPKAGIGRLRSSFLAPEAGFGGFSAFRVRIGAELLFCRGVLRELDGIGNRSGRGPGATLRRELFVVRRIKARVITKCRDVFRQSFSHNSQVLSMRSRL